MRRKKNAQGAGEFRQLDTKRGVISSTASAARAEKLSDALGTRLLDLSTKPPHYKISHLTSQNTGDIIKETLSKMGVFKHILS